MEKPYRKKILQGAPRLARCRLDVQTQIPWPAFKTGSSAFLNTGASVTNNTLVITAEQAQGLKLRNVALDEQLAKLSPPSSRAVVDDVMTNGSVSPKSLEIKAGEEFWQTLPFLAVLVRTLIVA